MAENTLFWRFFCVFLAFLGVFSAFGFDHTDSNRVLVVYNSSWTADADADGVQDSLQLTDYYCAFRGIPSNHVLGVETLTAYYYSTHEQFYEQLVMPVKDALSALGPTNIDVILLVYGVPYRTPKSGGGTICVDNCLMCLNRITTNNNLTGWKTNPYRETNPTFYTDKEHFDHALYKYSGQDIYMVCRLSAPDQPWGVINQLEQIRYAEKYLHTNGYKGCVYVDSRHGPYTDAGLSTNNAVINGSYGTYGDGDMNMAYGEHYVLDSALPLMWENKTGDYEIGEAGALFQVATNALFYEGWYNFGRYIDAFEWLPGSIGCDLNSDSASGMRSGRAWVGGAFRQGLSCGLGVIGEPYLNGHQRPNVMLYYLLLGYTFAEASMLATPYMEWQCANLGDPLYAPLRPKSLQIDTSAPVLAEGYPGVTNIGRTNAVIIFEIASTNTEPEVVTPRVSYGLTPDCPLTNTSRKGYWIHNAFTLNGLNSGTTYYYRVTLIDPAGHAVTSAVSAFETLNSPPVAAFNMDAATGTAPFTVTFHAGASTDADGYVQAWAWDFGDGTSGTGMVVAHTFTNPGLTAISLTVTDDDGAVDATADMIRVEPAHGVMRLLQYGRDDFTSTWDTYITTYSAGYVNQNFGARDYAYTYSASRRSMIRFDLSDLPSDAVVEQADLRLYCYQKNYGGASDYWTAYVMTQAWVEGEGSAATNGPGATWMDYDRGNPWNNPGGDFDSNRVAHVSYTNITAEDWVVFDVHEFVTNWLAGNDENHGLMLKPRDDDCLVNFRTKEYAASELRPMLLIIYTDPSSRSITACADAHGQISPSGQVEINIGEDAIFTISADPYYHIGDILTNGAHTSGSPFSDHSFTNFIFVWSNVVDNGTLNVSFAENLASHATPVWWLAHHGFTGDLDHAATGDQDGDGLETWEEYIAGCVPTSAASVFRIQQLGYSSDQPGRHILAWPGSSNRCYHIEYTTNLPSVSFQLLGTASNLPATPPINSYTNENAPGGAMFYRINVRLGNEN
ncbi:MAG: TIGR03790 family protein [Spartobacteria bacterium]|nr:TIGR03790 family protein [Spartobacteria bacterium]